MAALLEAWPVNSYPYVVQLPSGSIYLAAGIAAQPLVIALAQDSLCAVVQVHNNLVTSEKRRKAQFQQYSMLVAQIKLLGLQARQLICDIM